MPRAIGELKKCSKCHEIKNVNEFFKDKNKKDGFEYLCKLCKKEYIKKYQKRIKEYHHNRYLKYKEKINKQNKNWKIKNYEKNRNTNHKYWLNNKHILQPKAVLKRRIKRQTDNQFKTIDNIRRRINSIIKNNVKSDNTMKLIGCSKEKLMNHLQQSAKNNNYIDFNIFNYSSKEYEIDHIKPCSSFDLSKPEEQKKCFNYKNLQILTIGENRKKSNKIIKRSNNGFIQKNIK